MGRHTLHKGIVYILVCGVLLSPQTLRAQATPPQRIDLVGLSRSFESLAERIKPAVVQIYVTGYDVGGSFGGGDLLSKQYSGGSGVILDPNGYIVTNAHVVDGARRIQVIMSEPHAPGSPGESILKAGGKISGAQLVGLDRPTDLAVLKISGKNLPFMTLGDSDDLHPGQLVMTLGSPLGLENTVTLGVVSAVARQLQPQSSMIYIQTDASINPGNSGGPLVDMQGRVVGINTLILSQSGGSEGLSFAAPSNIVKNVFNQIRTTGRMRRGVIGVNAQTITPMMAEALKLSRTWGVILSDVYPGGPAIAMGLKPGDIILSLDGKVVENGRQLQVNLYSRHIGEQITLEVLRGTETFTAQVPVGEPSDDPGRFKELVTPKQNLIPRLGILGLDLSQDIIEMIPFLREHTGVVVAAGSAGMSSRGQGLLPGDVIHSINGQSVESLVALQNEIDQLKAYTPIVLHVERQGELMYVVLEIE